MEVHISIKLKSGSDEKFMGPGPYNLLVNIDKLGSLRQAALEMGMSYAKAHKILKNLEETLDIQLTDKRIGGKEHGGSELTEQAREFMRLYCIMTAKVNEQAAYAFAEFSEELKKIKRGRS